MVFSVLAFFALVVSVCLKNRTKALVVQSLNCVFEAIYDFIIGAYTGGVLSIINFIRSMLFINKDKFGKIIYRGILVIFESIIIINCIFTYQGYISLLPTVGSLIRTYCLWQDKMIIMRLSGVTTGILYGLYYCYYQSWFMVMGDMVLLFVSLYAIYINDVKKERK